MEIINIMKCKTCGNEIQYDGMEYIHFNEFIDKTFGKHSFFNMLTFADKHIKCCKNPDYHFPNIEEKIKEVSNA